MSGSIGDSRGYGPRQQPMVQTQGCSRCGFRLDPVDMVLIYATDHSRNLAKDLIAFLCEDCGDEVLNFAVIAPERPAPAPQTSPEEPRP